MLICTLLIEALLIGTTDHPHCRDPADTALPVNPRYAQRLYVHDVTNCPCAQAITHATHVQVRANTTRTTRTTRSTPRSLCLDLRTRHFDQGRS
jgi:hypothetical protein